MSVYTQRNLFSLILTRVGFISLWWFSANLQYYFIQKYWILKHRIFPAFVICSKRFVSTTTNQRMRRDMCLCVVSANSLCVCRLSDERRNCERYIKALSRWMMEWPACEHILRMVKKACFLHSTEWLWLWPIRPSSTWNQLVFMDIYSLSFSCDEIKKSWWQKSQNFWWSEPKIYMSARLVFICVLIRTYFFSHLFSIPCVQRSFYTCTYDGPTLEPILMQIHGNYFWQNKHHAEIYCTCSAYIYVCMANTHNTYSSRTSTWCLNIWSKNVYDKIIWRSVMACFLASDCWSCVISSFDTYSTYRCVKASGSLTGFNVMSRNVCGKCHHIRDNLSRIKQVSFRYHFRIVQAQNEYFFSFIQVTSVAGKNSIAMLYLALSSRTYFFCQWNNSRMNK